MRIVHCADVHLRRPFTGLDSPALAAHRLIEQKEAFSFIIDQARSADALLIAGDLFDDACYDHRLVHWVAEQFASIPDTRIFISPGNHDSYHPTSVYGVTVFPDNVVVFQGETEGIDCGGYTVYGNAGYPIGNPALQPTINLLCVHGDLFDDAYNRITTAQLAQSGFQYVALGHVHTFSGIQKAGNTTYAYSGVPFPGGFDELGEKGIVVGTVEQDGCDLSFVPVPGRQYREEEVVLEQAAEYDAVEQAILQATPHREQDFYKILLKGTLTPGFSLRTDVLQKRLQGQFAYLKIKADCREALSLEEMADAYTLKGLFVRNVQRLLEEAPDDPQILRALELGLAALENRKEGLDAD